SLLVELLADISGKEASGALANRALFELSREVRKQAIEALATRPRAEFLHILVNGLNHPWPPAAAHAAEALAKLSVEEAVPDLIGMLNQADPRLPFVVQENSDKVLAVREL